MSEMGRLRNPDGDSTEFPQKLMVRGFVYPTRSELSWEVSRGMTILSKEGLDAGKVAAVVLSGENQGASHILLGRQPQRNGYWLVPVEWIAEVQDDRVQLSIPEAALEDLPRWHAS